MYGGSKQNNRIKTITVKKNLFYFVVTQLRYNINGYNRTLIQIIMYLQQTSKLKKLQMYNNTSY